MLITPSLKKKLIVEQFQENYLKAGVHVKAVLTLLYTVFLPISQSLLGGFV